jgi:hypothetical protein
VIEKQGYQYWAPVSAFTPARFKTSVNTNNWSDFLDVNDCCIKQDPLIDSSLFPDYVLGKLPTTSSSSQQISFAESKGTSNLLTGIQMPPKSWVNQSKNAEFYFRGVRETPAQCLLVATRICPSGRKNETRKIRVRGWNSSEPEVTVSPDAFMTIVCMHYYGICKRIGLEGTANAMVAARAISGLNNRLKREDLSVRERNAWDQKIVFWRANHDSNLDLSKSELQLIDLPHGVVGNPRREFFQMADRRLSVGLDRSAVEIIHRFQEIDSPFTIEDLRVLSNRILAHKKVTDESSSFYIRNDGIICLTNTL